jgi:FkbM family methyltransferase
MTLTREHVVWAYRILLDREPESEEVILPKMRAYGTTRELRHDIVTSEEYETKNRDFAQANDRTLVLTEITDGLRLWVDLADHAIGLNIVRGRFELNEVDFIRRTVKPGDSVIDCGAHVGYFTMHLADCVGPEGSVLALEPFTDNADCLERSIRENDFGTRVRLVRGAAGERDGIAEIVFAPRTLNSGGAYLRRPDEAVPPGHRAARVDVVSLDESAARRPVRFIKADIEGAEPLAFRGASRILSEDRPLVLSELHPAQLQRVSGVGADELLADMRGRGYRCRHLGAGVPGEPIDRAPRDGVTSVVFLPE